MLAGEPVDKKSPPKSLELPGGLFPGRCRSSKEDRNKKCYDVIFFITFCFLENSGDQNGQNAQNVVQEMPKAATYCV